MGFDLVGLEVHPLAGDAFHAGECAAELVLHQLPDRTDPPIAEVVDVVDVFLADVDLDQERHRVDDVLRGEHGQLGAGILIVLFIP
ncbi:hypothetical protein SDC9_156168 [bioreactor metagenome]|uniref:Uncharacterized protein n=1 Tax=bioreactor metagenome TaxID=1076179 RepID=A0A645F5T5_9ZZZZ